MFFGSGKDQSINQMQVYRKNNVACSEMDLSTSTLDSPTFRSLIKCLNANGAIDPIDRMINGPNGLSDRDLLPLVKATNQYFLGNHHRIYEFDQTYQSLDSNGSLNKLLSQLGLILENDEFITGTVALLKDGYWSPSNQDILKTLQLLSEKLTPENTSASLDLALNLANSRAFAGLIGKIRSTSLSRNDRFENWVQQLFKYLKSPHTYTCDNSPTPIKGPWIQAIQNDDLFTITDRLFGTEEEQIKTQVPKWAATLREILQPDPTHPGHVILDNLSAAFHDLNGEIRCMKSSEVIPNGAMHLFRELHELGPGVTPTQYFLRDLPLTLASLKPFCEVPDSLASYYPSLTELARSGAMEAVSESLMEFYKIEAPWQGCNGGDSPQGTYHPLAQGLVNLLGDNQNSFHLLVPLLVEITESENWGDLLLLLTLNKGQNLQQMKDTLKYAVRPLPQLNGKSISDIFVEALTTKDHQSLFRWLLSIKTFIHSNDTILVPTLKNLRGAFFVNNVHPVLDLTREILADAPKNSDLYRTLFALTDKEDFSKSIQLVSAMAKDGRLKNLMDSVVRLFHKFAEEQSDGARIVVAHSPRLAIETRHNLSSADLTHFYFDHSPEQRIIQDCDQINLGFSLDQTSDSRFGEQLQAILDCQNGKGPKNDLTTTIEFLKNSTTESGQSYLDFQIGLVKQFDFTAWDLRYLMDSWTQSFDDGRFNRLLNAAALWIHGAPPLSPVLKSLLDLTNSLMETVRVDIQELETYFAKVTDSETAPSLLATADDLFSREFAPTPGAGARPQLIDQVFDDKFRQRLAKWVDYKECTGLPADSKDRTTQIQKRVSDLILEAKNNLTSWDLVDQTPQKPGHPRQSWTLDGPQGLTTWLKPVLQKISDKNQSSKDKWVLDSLLNFLQYFSLTDTPDLNAKVKAHYPPQTLLKWLHDRATDYRPITYYYPGEDKPRIKIVNTLDMLELVLLNVDFDAPMMDANFDVYYKNMGYDFLDEIGKAWGDIKDRSQWPKEIQDEFPDPAHPPRTLAAAVADIKNRPYDPKKDAGFDNLHRLVYELVGLPTLPPCHKDIPGEDVDLQAPAGMANGFLPDDLLHDFQKRIYNILQNISALDVNTPGSGVGFNGGLEVLRDLFYEIIYSTPKESRGPSAGDKNNFSVIMKFIRVGTFRQLGRILGNLDPNDPALNHFFTTLIHASKTPHLRDAAIALLANDPNQELIWKVLQQIFDIVDHGTPEDLATLKRLGFYSLSSMSQLEPWPRPSTASADPDLLDLILLRAFEVLQTYTPFLKTQTPLLKDALTSKRASEILQATYELGNEDQKILLRNFLADLLQDTSSGRPSVSRVQNGMEIFKAIYETPAAKAGWQNFNQNSRKLLDSDAYKALKAGDALRPVLNFLEQRNPAQSTVTLSRDEKELSDKLRKSGAKMLREKQLEAYLLLSKNHPTEFYAALQTLSRVIGEGTHGDLKDFLKMVRRSLSEPAH